MYISDFKHGVAMHNDGNDSFIIDTDFKRISPTFSGYFDLDKEYAEVTIDGKKGLLHRSGKMVIEPQYVDVIFYNEHCVFAFDEKREKGFILKKDVPSKIFKIENFTPVFLFMQEPQEFVRYIGKKSYTLENRDDKSLVIINEKKEIIFSGIEDACYCEKYYCVKKDGNWMFLDDSFKMVKKFPKKYKEINGFHRNANATYVNLTEQIVEIEGTRKDGSKYLTDKIIFIDSNGKVIYNEDVVNCYNFNEFGYASISRKKFTGWELLDLQGNVKRLKFDSYTIFINEQYLMMGDSRDNPPYYVYDYINDKIMFETNCKVYYFDGEFFYGTDHDGDESSLYRFYLFDKEGNSIQQTINLLLRKLSNLNRFIASRMI